MKEDSAQGFTTKEVYVPASERKPVRREESSLAKEILKFNRDALAVVNGLNSGLRKEKKVKLVFSKNENEQEEYQIVLKPIHEKWIEDKKGVVEVESEEVELETRTFSTDGASILDEYNVYVELSSNREFADTPESGLLAKLTIVKKESNDREMEPALDAFVSFQGGIRDGKMRFDSYSRPKLTEDQEIIFLEVADLMRAAKENLQSV